MTKNEAKEAALRWIDEATVNGSEPVSGELEDYRDRMDYLLDGVQAALAAAFPLDGCFAATICPVPNLLGGAHALRAAAPGEPLVLNAAGARSAYLEISGAAGVSAPGTAAEQTAATGGFEPVRLRLPQGGPVTVRGRGQVLVRHAALYAAEFDRAAEIPAFAPETAVTLPEDFCTLRQIIRTGGGPGTVWSNYRQEGARTFRLPSASAGEYRFWYVRRPRSVPHDAPGDTELDCAPQAESLIPLKLAADTLMGTPDRAGTAYYLENCYSTRLQMLRSEQTEAPVRIEPVYR